MQIWGIFMSRMDNRMGDDLASVIGEDLVCHLVTTILTDSDAMTMTFGSVRWKGRVIQLAAHWCPEWQTQHWTDVDHLTSEFLHWNAADALIATVVEDEADPKCTQEPTTCRCTCLIKSGVDTLLDGLVTSF